MSKPLRIIFVALILCLSLPFIQAQTGGDAYADMAKSRTADGAFVLGDPQARVKLIEFSDFLCTSCQNYERVVKRFIQDYVASGKARYEHRIYPVIDAQLSAYSASLVECADILQPGQFWRARDLMFEMVSTRGFTDETVSVFAEDLGHEAGALAECAAEANQHINDARYGIALGADATPSLFVQYGDAAPLPIALALPEHHAAIVNALRPASTAPLQIEAGRYAGLQTFRRADGGFTLGDPDAPITIVTFEDFLCPHCQNYQSTVDAFVEEYVRAGKAQIEFRFYPLVDRRYSTAFAKTAECVAAQAPSRFWDAHDLLFEFARRQNLDDVAAKAARLLELDAVALEACLERAIQFLVDTRLAQSAFVAGTPAVRARQDGGPLELIYLGEEPIQRGAPTIFQLRDLMDGVGSISIGPPDPTSLADSYLADTSLVTGEPCAPPCWQDIVPGETSVEEARVIVEAAGFTIIEGARSGFQFANESGIACCEIGHYQDIDGTVSDAVAAVLLRLAPTSELGALIENYGEPTAVYSPDPSETAQAHLSLVFADARMILSVSVESADQPIQPNSKVVDAAYFSPELMDQIMRLMRSEPRWHGYLSPNQYLERAAEN